MEPREMLGMRETPFFRMAIFYFRLRSSSIGSRCQGV